MFKLATIIEIITIIKEAQERYITQLLDLKFAGCNSETSQEISKKLDICNNILTELEAQIEK